MNVKFKKFYDIKQNRIVFSFINYDYYDGNDYLAELFKERYNFVVKKKIDGWWYSIIHICNEHSEYELLWHEDIGNEIYSLIQTDKENEILENRLNNIVDIINKRISSNS